MKKVLSVILVFVILCSTFAGLQITSHALASSGSCGTNVNYTFDSSTGLLTISGSGAMKNYSSSSSNRSPFYNQTLIKKVVINSGVTSIGNYAFYYCSGLTSITIPDSVTSIGDGAFYYCSGLTSITIPDSVTSIGGSAFFCCSGLKELTMPCSAKIYNDENTFFNCTNIEKVTLTKGTGTMQNYATSNSSSNTYYQYTPWYKSRNSFRELVIEDGVKSIGDYAFYNCSGLTSITIPNSVTSIGNNAFYGCSGCKSIYYKGNESSFNSISVGSSNTNFTNVTPLCFSGQCGENLNYTFTMANNTGVLTISGSGYMTSFASVQKSPFAYSQIINHVIIKSGVSNIGNYAFTNCEKIKNISFPNTLTSIGVSAFANCSGITSVNFPNSITTIGNNAFNGCSGLTNITAKDSVTAVGNNAFANCTNLTTATFGDSLTTVGDNTFENCSNLTEVTFGKSLTTVGLNPLNNCTNIEKVTVLSEQIESTQNIVANMPVGSTLYAPESTDAQLYCSIYGINYVHVVSDDDCANGNHGLIVKRIEPTCSEEGSIEYSCYNCDYYRIETLPIVDHDFEITEVVPATCISKGYTVKTCSMCGENYKTDYVDKTDEHDYKAAVTTPATCTQKGVKTFTCSVCGDTYTEDIAMTEHEPVTDEAVAPTCTKAGLTAGSHCSRCGTVITAQSVVSATGHNYNSVVTAPTCKDMGYTTYTCSTCGDSYIDDYVQADETAHVDVVDEAVEPTCLHSGLTQGSHCSRCGKVITEQTTIPAKEHSIKTSVTDPTCTQVGYTVYTCEDCGYGYVADFLPVLDHTMVVDKAVEPTCTKAGLTQGSHCSVCGYVITEQTVIPATGHTFNNVVVAPTCYEQGYTSHTCTVCGYTCADNYTPVIEHNSVVDKAVAATCTKAGLTKGSHCSICGTVLEKQEVIPATGHSYNSVVTAPTCKTKGYTTHTCSDCGDSYKDTYTAMTSTHNYTSTITSVATCSKTGVKKFTCSVCGDIYTETISRLRHTTVVDGAVAPTCTKTGLSEGTHCSVCGYVITEQKIIPATGHKYSNLVTVSTCKEQGYTTYTCEDCGYSYVDESTPFAEHMPVTDEAVAPTCTKAGLTQGSHCSVCGKVITEQTVVPVLEHNYTSQIVEPTCSHSGYTSYTCENCGHSYADNFVDKLAHNYKDTVVEPTTESQGYTVHTCTVCGFSYVDSITDILPSEMHYIIPSLEEINATLTIKSNENEYSVTSANGVFELDNIKGDVYRVYASQKNSLTVCIGEYDTKNGELVNNDVVIPVGNVNGDDVIDMADISLLLSSKNYGKPNANLDLTGDKQITVEDISIVLQSQNFGAQSVPIV